VVQQAVVDDIGTLSAMLTELATSLPAESFERELSDRSNAIGEQFWCVVGARESYAAAIDSDGWVGFSCSLPGWAAIDKEKVVEALTTSALLIDEATNDVEWTATRDQLALALLEHEAQHHGQLIRFVYALDYEFPDSWKERWALT
jgi:hypothetical protein